MLFCCSKCTFDSLFSHIFIKADASYKCKRHLESQIKTLGAFGTLGLMCFFDVYVALSHFCYGKVASKVKKVGDPWFRSY